MHSAILDIHIYRYLRDVTTELKLLYVLRKFISSCSRNENCLELPRVEFYDIHIVKKEKSWCDRTRLEDIIYKCNMPPFSKNCAISAFLEVTETFEILQPLINIFDKDLNTNAYLVIIYEKKRYFSESKTIDVHCLGSNVPFPSSQTRIFLTYRCGR